MNALTFYRFGRWCYLRRIPVIPQLAYQAISLLFNAAIPMSAEIGEGVELAYGGMGIVLHERCKIGRFVSIGHQVTIGGRSRRWGVPVIEDRAVIGAGAKLLGPISVGAEAVIGANAVVLHDVPPRTVVAGMPARVVRTNIDIREYSCLQPPEEAEALSHRTTDNLLVTRIEEPGRVPHLTEEWRELLADSAADSLFLTPDWLMTWWEHFGADKTLALITLRRHSRLLGLAPMFVRARRFGSLVPHSSMECLGTGVVGSDYLDVIIRRGHEAEVSRGLAEYLQRQDAVVTLSHMRRDRPAADAFIAELELAGWTVRRRTIETCPYIPLQGHTWDSYLASLGPSHRYNFQRRLKNLHKLGTLVFETVEKEDQRRDALAALLALHNRRWDEQGGSEAMQSLEELAFHDDFSRTALERGWLRLSLLRLDGRPIGALYGLRRGRTFYFYQSGFDPAFRQQSAGLVTMGLAIRQALAEGVEEYDLLHGTESYKFLWTDRTRDLVKIELFPPSMRGLLCRGALRGEAAAKRLARRALPERMLKHLTAMRRKAA
jgi:serine acetyltransferase/CelD/BcsL family acetyltransferase involved in cellulose biosynthesis